jgi:hypothetical protein
MVVSITPRMKENLEFPSEGGGIREIEALE